MSSFSFSEMYDEAVKAGAVSTNPPDGTYDFEVVGASSGETISNQDPKFGIQFRVASGPHAGKSFWDTVSFVPPRGDRAGNLAIAFRTMSSFGIDGEFFSANPTPEQVKERILQIPPFTADFKTVEKNGYTNVKFARIKIKDGAAPAPATPQGGAGTVPAFQAPAASPAATAPSF